MKGSCSGGGRSATERRLVELVSVDVLTFLIAWMNTNAPAIQAFAAIATLLATIVLAGLTWRYVTLTGDLVKVAARSEVLDRDHLVSLGKMLQWRLDRLPAHKLPGDEAFKQFERAQLWSEDDLRTFLELSARVVGVAHGMLAATVANHLSRISDAVSKMLEQGSFFSIPFDWANGRRTSAWQPRPSAAFSPRRSILRKTKGRDAYGENRKGRDAGQARQVDPRLLRPGREAPLGNLRHAEGGVMSSWSVDENGLRELAASDNFDKFSPRVRAQIFEILGLHKEARAELARLRPKLRLIRGGQA